MKKFGGEVVIPGNIIIRQRGTKYYPGDGVGMGKDHTLLKRWSRHVSKNQRIQQKEASIC